MSADAYATDDGRFEIKVYRWRDSKFLGSIILSGLEPREALGVDVGGEDAPYETCAHEA